MPNVVVSITVFEPMGAGMIQPNANEIRNASNIENIASRCQNSVLLRKREEVNVSVLMNARVKSVSTLTSCQEEMP